MVLALLIAQSVTALALSDNGKYLAAGFSDGFIRVYDPATGACIASRVCHDGEVMSLDYLGDTLLSSGMGKIGVWWAETLGVGKALPVEPHMAVHAAFFRKEGKEVVSTDAGHRLRLWDFRKRKLRKELKYTGQDVNLVPACAAVSPDGRYFFIGFQGWVWELWDLHEWKCAIVVDVWSPVRRYAVCFSPDGKTLAFGEDDVVSVYEVTDAATLKDLKTIEVPDTATALLFSRDGSFLFVGTKSGLVQAWRAEDCKKLVEAETGKGRVNALAVGELLYAGCENGLAILPMAFREE